MPIFCLKIIQFGIDFQTLFLSFLDEKMLEGRG